MLSNSILINNNDNNKVEPISSSKNSVILSDLKYFYSWQLSWRKVLGRSVIYIDATTPESSTENGNTIQYTETKKQRIIIKQFCKQFKATVVDFFDSENVTIIISRRKFSRNEDYGQSDIFHKHENFRIWPYEKAVRFFEKLTKKLPIPIELKIEIQRQQHKIRHDDLKLNEVKRFEMYENKKKVIKEKMLSLIQNDNKDDDDDSCKDKKYFLKQVEIKKIEQENKIRFEKEVFEKQRFEKELEIERQRIEKVRQLEIEKLSRDKLRIEKEKDKQRKQIKFEIYNYCSSSLKNKKLNQQRLNKLRKISSSEMIVSQPKMNIINNNRTKLINNLCKISNSKNEIITTMIAKEYKKKDFKTQVFEMIKSSQNDNYNYHYHHSNGKKVNKGNKNVYKNYCNDYNKKDLATLLNKEKRHGPADRFIRTESIHYFEGPFVFLYDLEQHYRPILKAEYFEDLDDNKVVRQWSTIARTVNGHSLFIGDNHSNDGTRKKRKIELMLNENNNNQLSSYTNDIKKRKHQDLMSMNASGISQSNITTNNPPTNDNNNEICNLKNGLGPGQSYVASKEYKLLKKRHTSNKAFKVKDVDNNIYNNNHGYCENCRIKYHEFAKHIKELKHREFATNQKNFVKIDSFIELLKKS